MYEEIKETLIGISIAGIKSIIEGERKVETKYNLIKYIVEGAEDILNEVYKLENKEKK